MPMKIHFSTPMRSLLIGLLTYVSVNHLCIAHEVDDLKVHAKQGDIIAMFKLGALYYDGKNVPLDPKQIVTYYTRTANKGDAVQSRNHLLRR